MPKRTNFGLKEIGFGSERADFGPERGDFRSESVDLGLMELISSLKELDIGHWGAYRRTKGHQEIHPCVLQDIDPLGPLPCFHSITSFSHSKQGIGYR